jgi:hypothetical protein
MIPQVPWGPSGSTTTLEIPFCTIRCSASSTGISGGTVTTGEVMISATVYGLGFRSIATPYPLRSMRTTGCVPILSGLAAL